MTPTRRPRPWWRWLGTGVLLVVAFAAGSVAAFVHRTTVQVLGVDVPLGLLVAGGALVGLVLLARLVGRSRVAVLLVGTAFAVPVLVLSQFRPEGDLVVAEDAFGLTLLGATALVITAGVVVPFPAYHDGHGADVPRPDLPPRPLSEMP